MKVNEPFGFSTSFGLDPLTSLRIDSHCDQYSTTGLHVAPERPQIAHVDVSIGVGWTP